LQEENKENLKKDLFYVECLVPPIEVSKVITGSKIRRMSEIPGRETSFIKPKTPIKIIRNQVHPTSWYYSSSSLERPPLL
jgi:hypothetical protein